MVLSQIDLDNLKDNLKDEILETQDNEFKKLNENLQNQIIDLKQRLNITLPSSNEEDNIDIIINSHMRDISADNRPQMSNAGLELNNKHFKDLSNHELHKIKNIYEKDHKKKSKTILDENLGEIMDKCINFLSY